MAVEFDPQTLREMGDSAWRWTETARFIDLVKQYRADTVRMRRVGRSYLQAIGYGSQELLDAYRRESFRDNMHGYADALFKRLSSVSDIRKMEQDLTEAAINVDALVQFDINRAYHAVHRAWDRVTREKRDCDTALGGLVYDSRDAAMSLPHRRERLMTLLEDHPVVLDTIRDLTLIEQFDLWFAGKHGRVSPRRSVEADVLLHGGLEAVTLGHNAVMRDFHYRDRRIGDTKMAWLMMKAFLQATEALGMERDEALSLPLPERLVAAVLGNWSEMTERVNRVANWGSFEEGLTPVEDAPPLEDRLALYERLQRGGADAALALGELGRELRPVEWARHCADVTIADVGIYIVVALETTDLAPKLREVALSDPELRAALVHSGASLIGERIDVEFDRSGVSADAFLEGRSFDDIHDLVAEVLPVQQRFADELRMQSEMTFSDWGALVDGLSAWARGEAQGWQALQKSWKSYWQPESGRTLDVPYHSTQFLIRLVNEQLEAGATFAQIGFERLESGPVSVSEGRILAFLVREESQPYVFTVPHAIDVDAWKAERQFLQFMTDKIRPEQTRFGSYLRNARVGVLESLNKDVELRARFADWARQPENRNYSRPLIDVLLRGIGPDTPEFEPLRSELVQAFEVEGAEGRQIDAAEIERGEAVMAGLRGAELVLPAL